MILKKVYHVICERIKEGTPEKSYVAKLHMEGEQKILKKISEECFELIMAARGNDTKEIVHEASDLIFHLLILLAEKNIKPEAILTELERRFGISGIEEKKQRKRSET